MRDSEQFPVAVEFTVRAILCVELTRKSACKTPNKISVPTEPTPAGSAALPPLEPPETLPFHTLPVLCCRPTRFSGTAIRHPCIRGLASNTSYKAESLSFQVDDRLYTHKEAISIAQDTDYDDTIMLY
jgi:hypothetical protein